MLNHFQGSLRSVPSWPRRETLSGDKMTPTRKHPRRRGRPLRLPKLNRRTKKNRRTSSRRSSDRARPVNSSHSRVRLKMKFKASKKKKYLNKSNYSLAKRRKKLFFHPVPAAEQNKSRKKMKWLLVTYFLKKKKMCERLLWNALGRNTLQALASQLLFPLLCDWKNTYSYELRTK